MDYIGNKCPVCDKYFHANEDIVVCPECGTPCHRECYQSIGHCINADKHKDGYDYQEDIKNTQSEAQDGIVVCKKCGAKNSDNAFFCTKCGNNLHETQQNTQTGFQGNTQQSQHDGAPFGYPPYPNNNQNNPSVIMFDPLAGVSPNTDIGDGVTAGEAAKFVKQNTPYFITIFNNIKNYSKSRFNFCGMFFSGGYLLFRKMYKVGGVITAIQAMMTILYFYLNYYITTSNSYDKLFDAVYAYDTNATALYLSQLSTHDVMMIFLYVGLAFMMFVMSIVIGACANRMYYAHCKKQILKIKSEVQNPQEVSDTLTKKGGVNIALGISLWITYIIISYLPIIFS